MYYSKRTAFTLITVYLFLVGFASIQGDAHPKPRVILAETSADTLEITEALPEYDYLYTDNCPLHGRCSRMHYRADTIIDSITIYTKNYHPPTLVGHNTSGYGPRWGRLHNGIDIAYNNGDTSYAVFDGVVRLTSQGYSGGYGNLAIVRHFNGLETYYAHHRALLVEEGDTITAGTPLGIIGSTGRSGGPHLHFEARFLGLPMDPAVLVDSTQIPSELILEREGEQYLIKEI